MDALMLKATAVTLKKQPEADKLQEMARIQTDVAALIQKTRPMITKLTVKKNEQEVAEMRAKFQRDEAGLVEKIATILTPKEVKLAPKKEPLGFSEILQKTDRALNCKFRDFGHLCTLKTPSDPVKALELVGALHDKVEELRGAVRTYFTQIATVRIPEDQAEGADLFARSIQNRLQMAEDVLEGRRARYSQIQLPVQKKALPPVGIHRPSDLMNCWANCDLQVLETIPSLQKKLEADQDLSVIHRNYQVAQRKGASSLDQAHAKLIRSALGDKVDQNNKRQEDAAHGLSSLLEKLKFETHLVKKEYISSFDGMIEVEDVSKDTVLRLSTEVDVGERSLEEFIKFQMNLNGQKFQGKAPEELVLHVSRAGAFQYKDDKGNLNTIATKDMLPLDSSLYTYIDGNLVEDGKGALYKTKAAIIHLGNAHGGHYVCVVEKGGNHFYINDGKVEEITLAQAKKHYADADIFYLEKIKTPEIQTTHLPSDDELTEGDIEARG